MLSSTSDRCDLQEQTTNGRQGKIICLNSIIFSIIIWLFLFIKHFIARHKSCAHVMLPKNNNTLVVSILNTPYVCFALSHSASFCLLKSSYSCKYTPFFCWVLGRVTLSFVRVDLSAWTVSLSGSSTSAKIFLNSSSSVGIPASVGGVATVLGCNTH